MINATTICRLCQLSYAQQDENFVRWAERVESSIEEILSDVDRVTCYHGSGSETFVALDDSYTYVIHRGSAGLIDWIDNALAMKTDNEAFGVEDARTHLGATAAGKRMWEQIACDLPKQLPIIHAGHSRGGAIACDTAMRSMAEGVPVHRLVTFGAHRYANWIGASYMRNLLGPAIRRFVHTVDPVPLLPLPFTYRHAGRPTYLDSMGNAHERPTWRYQVIDQFATMFKAWREDASIVDAHMLLAYEAALKEAEKGGSLL